MEYTFKFDASRFFEESFEAVEKKIFRYVCDMGVEITKKMFEQLDYYLMVNRDKKRYKSKDFKKTSIKTIYGTVAYSRRIYFDTEKQEYVFLLDDKLQMEKIGTISTNLAKKIAEAAIDMPYRKAADTISETTGQTISSHGVWNVTQQIGQVIQDKEQNLVQELHAEQTRGKKASKVIFMESDGVYLHIQKNKKKASSMEMKVATVYDGWEDEGTKLHNKVVVAGMETGKKFNEKTEAVIQSVFDIDAAQLRVLNGDGANWIKNTYEPDRIFQLDRFHIKKEIRRCIPERNIRNQILNKFENNKMDEMLEDIRTYINSIDDGTDDKKVDKATGLYNYLSNNYEGLLPWQLQAETQLGKIPEAPDGIIYKNMGVQENQNCSLISIRLARRKTRWSEAGANNLAKLIYMRENGELDEIIELADGKIMVPAEVVEKLSAAKIQKKVGKGNKWMDTIQVTIPLLETANGSYSKLLRNIQNI
ncbi:MAG: ISLre2 family transposase [Wujia sp.]